MRPRGMTQWFLNSSPKPMNQDKMPPLSVFSRVNMIPIWNDIDIYAWCFHTRIMPRTRMDELIAIAEENDGLLTSKQARNAGILDSVLVRLTQRGRLERTARGVYRIAHFPQSRFSQYREALLWAEANHGPEEPEVALSHETALALYGISDANPQLVHITVPKAVRLRRERPKWIAVHHGDLHPLNVTLHEGLAVTTVARTIRDVLDTTGRIDLARKAVADAKRTGFIRDAEAVSLKREIDQFAHRLNAVSIKHKGGQA